MRPRIRLDEGLVDEVGAALDLRTPNAEALAAIAGRLAAHQASGVEEPFESVVDVATGVGKTYVMAGTIEYLAQLGVRNFVVVTHRNAILDKTLNNFTPGHPKSVVDHMTVRPTVVTVDDLDSGSAQAAMADDDQVKVHVLSIQSLLRPTTKVGRRTHDFREVLGEGYYDHLNALDDLVIFADEHHCYYGPAFSRAMRDLTPMALVGLTGTPHEKTPSDQVIYRYPLAEAIADRLVKTPVVVGRSDDLADDTTKLRDGLTLLRAKQRAADAWAAQTDLPQRNLLMLVVAESIEEAADVEELLTSESMFDGEYRDHVLRIDSSQPDEALEALEEVEDPNSPVRVIVSVQMLQEGWDVATVAVIVSLRASVSSILTEQTLGRGLRLPWGRYVDVPLLNQLDVVAHERYEQVLKRAGVALTEQRVDWASWRREQQATAEALAARAASAEAATAVQEQLDTLIRLRDSHHEGDESPEDGYELVVERVEDRQRDVEADADTAERTMRPRRDLGRLQLPVVATRQVTSSYRLADVAPTLVPTFRKLGATYASSPDDTLRRTEVSARVEVGEDGVPRTVVTTQAAMNPVLSVTGDTAAPNEIATRVTMAILHSAVASGRREDRQPARMLAEAVLDGAGEDAPVLGRYVDQLCGAVVHRLERAVAEGAGHLETVDEIALAPIDWPRARPEVVLHDHHGEFNRRVGYAGWQRSLYEVARFDSAPERSLAVLLDESPTEVELWVRLQQSDLAVNWTGTGQTYHPDFLVAEPTMERHGRLSRPCWVVEVKADNRLDDDEVARKHEAAVRWAARVNADGAAEPDEWHVLLAGEGDIAHARGSWKRLRQLARTDLGS